MKSPINRYINENTWDVVDESAVRDFHPNITVADADFPIAPHAPVEQGPVPAFNPLTQVLVDLAPRHIDGRWETRYRIDALPAEVAAANAAQAKADKWAEIKAHRDHLSDTGGYKVNISGVDRWFHSDQKSKGQQLGLVLLGGAANQVPPWKTMDGSKVAMSQQLAQAIFAAAVQMDGALFAAAEAHKTAMEASDRPDLYDFSGGWAEVYGG